MEVNDVKALSLDELLERAGDIGYEYASSGGSLLSAYMVMHEELFMPNISRVSASGLFQSVYDGYWDGMQESELVNGNVYSALSEGGYE